MGHQQTQKAAPEQNTVLFKNDDKIGSFPMMGRMKDLCPSAGEDNAGFRETLMTESSNVTDRTTQSAMLR